MPLNEEGFVERVAIRHSNSPGPFAQSYRRFGLAVAAWLSSAILMTFEECRVVARQKLALIAATAGSLALYAEAAPAEAQAGFGPGLAGEVGNRSDQPRSVPLKSPTSQRSASDFIGSVAAVSVMTW